MRGRVLGRDGTFLACPIGGFKRLQAAWGARIYNSPMQLVSRKSWVWVRRQDAKKGKECHWELWELRNTYDVSWSYINFKIEIFDLLPWKIYFSMTSWEEERSWHLTVYWGHLRVIISSKGLGEPGWGRVTLSCLQPSSALTCSSSSARSADWGRLDPSHNPQEGQRCPQPVGAHLTSLGCKSTILLTWHFCLQSASSKVFHWPLRNTAGFFKTRKQSLKVC